MEEARLESAPNLVTFCRPGGGPGARIWKVSSCGYRSEGYAL